MANIVYRQMPAPQKLPQQIPTPRAKAWMQKPQEWDKVLVQIPGGAWGGMDETDTSIITHRFEVKSKYMSFNAYSMVCILISMIILITHNDI